MATDINNQGVVVGTSELPAVSPLEVHSSAFVYEAGMLRSLDVFGAPDSFANAINDKGQIVGAFGVGTLQQPEVHAFLYNPNEGVVDLGSPGFNSWAIDINEHGTIVGRAERIPGSGDYRAFVHEAVLGMKFLEDIIPSDSSWEKLFVARSINNLGQILGEGLINGEVHIYLLTPTPEPPSAILLLMAIAAANRVRQCRSVRGENSPPSYGHLAKTPGNLHRIHAHRVLATLVPSSFPTSGQMVSIRAELRSPSRKPRRIRAESHTRN